MSGESEDEFSDKERSLSKDDNSDELPQMSPTEKLFNSLHGRLCSIEAEQQERLRKISEFNLLFNVHEPPPLPPGLCRMRDEDELDDDAGDKRLRLASLDAMFDFKPWFHGKFSRQRFYTAIMSVMVFEVVPIYNDATLQTRQSRTYHMFALWLLGVVKTFDFFREKTYYNPDDEHTVSLPTSASAEIGLCDLLPVIFNRLRPIDVSVVREILGCAKDCESMHSKFVACQDGHCDDPDYRRVTDVDNDNDDCRRVVDDTDSNSVCDCYNNYNLAFLLLRGATNALFSILLDDPFVKDTLERYMHLAIDQPGDVRTINSRECYIQATAEQEIMRTTLNQNRAAAREKRKAKRLDIELSTARRNYQASKQHVVDLMKRKKRHQKAMNEKNDQ